MKPAPFAYRRASAIEEVLSCLSELGDEAKILAGGQSLVPLMSFRLASPTYLIDVNPLDSLRYIKRNGCLRIGALTRFRAIEDDLGLTKFPLLTEAIPLIGHPAIRNRGTVGGSLSHADSSAELPVIAVALDATISAIGPGGRREISADAFFVDYFETALTPLELLTELSIPFPDEAWGWSFQEMSRRFGDFAVVCVAVGLCMDESGLVIGVRLVAGGVGPSPIRLFEAEESLLGVHPNPDCFREAGVIASEIVNPSSDIHATSEYRKNLTKVLVERGLAAASQKIL